MSNRSSGKSHLEFVPGDLVLVAALGLWTVASAAGLLEWSIGQVALGLIAVLFAPGYALAAALFPAERRNTASHGIEDTTTRDDGTVSVVERVVLAVGLSVCITPLLGIGLNYTVGLDAPLFLSVIGTTTLLTTIIAIIRRWRVPRKKRFSPQISTGVFGVGDRITNLRTHSIVTILLIVGLIAAASGIGFAVWRADQGEQFTEFYIVTDDQTGEPVAGDYPAELAPGETGRLRIGITNHERGTTTYTVVALLQSIDESGESGEIQRLGTFTVTVPAGETVTRPHTIQPEMTGEGLRVTYLLYVGSVPDGSMPETDTAYRQVHFWIDVPPSASG